MFLVDDRIGSVEFLKALRLHGVPAEVVRLEFGDFAFEGRGEGGRPVQIGIERKTTTDLLGSLRSGRLQGHQLGGLLNAYDRAWVLVEGIWRTDDHGRLCRPIGRGRVVPIGTGFRPTKTTDLIKQLLTVCLRGGLHLWQTGTEHETVIFLSALYSFWTSKDLDDHKGHLAFHQTDMDKTMWAMMTGGQGYTTCRLIAKELPGVGMKYSHAVERHFGGSVQRMLTASAEEWAEIEVTAKSGRTRRLGDKAAAEVVAALK